MQVWRGAACSNVGSVFGRTHESFDWRIHLSISMIDGHFTTLDRVCKACLRYTHRLKPLIWRRFITTATIFLKLRIVRESEHKIGFLVVWHIFVIVQISQVLMLLVNVGSLLQPLKLGLKPLRLLLLGISTINVKVSLFNELLELG